MNNLCVRIFMRAAGLDRDEVDVWGKTTSPEYLAKYPAHLTPMLEEDGLLKHALGESCAIMAYLCNKHCLDRFYPTTRPPRDGRQRELLLDRHLLSAAHARDVPDALADPLEVFHTFFMDGQPFIGGDHPSIADIRLGATLEFLRAIDYGFPAWGEEYMARMEETVGDAYSEPAADVRGWVEQAKSASAVSA